MDIYNISLYETIGSERNFQLVDIVGRTELLFQNAADFRWIVIFELTICISKVKDMLKMNEALRVVCCLDLSKSDTVWRIRSFFLPATLLPSFHTSSLFLATFRSSRDSNSPGRPRVACTPVKGYGSPN